MKQNTTNWNLKNKGKTQLTKHKKKEINYFPWNSILQKYSQFGFKIDVSRI